MTSTVSPIAPAEADDQEQDDEQDDLDGHVDGQHEQAAGEPGTGHLKDNGLPGDDLSHGFPASSCSGYASLMPLPKANARAPSRLPLACGCGSRRLRRRARG